MIEFNHLYDVLERYSTEFVNELQMKLLENNSNASGTLVNSLHYIIEKGGTSVSVSIGLEDYWKYVENGRGAGKFPPIDKIREWIRVKPVIPEVINGKLPTVEQLAFLISRKIALEGTKGTHFFTEAQKDINNRFMQAIELAIVEDLQTEMDDILTILY